MEIKLICGDKYEFKSQTIGLPVKLENLPSRLDIGGNVLFLKESFHVSLVCIGKIIEKHSVSIPDFENKIINDFCEFSKTYDVKVLKYDEFKFAVKDDKKTIVAMCKVSNLDKFLKIMNKKYELDIEYPPTHVTLYTLESKPGIFLVDANDIKNFTKTIPNPIGRSL